MLSIVAWLFAYVLSSVVDAFAGVLSSVVYYVFAGVCVEFSCLLHIGRYVLSLFMTLFINCALAFVLSLVVHCASAFMC